MPVFAVRTALALAEDAALLARVEALAVLFQAFCLAAFAAPTHLGQLEPQVEDRGDFLDVFGEGSRVSGEGFEDVLLMSLVLIHVAAAHAVAVLRAEYL